MKPADDIGKRTSRHSGARIVILVGAICCVGLFITVSFNSMKTTMATRSSASPPDLIQAASVGPVSPGGVASSSFTPLPPFVIHLPPRSYFIEANGIQRDMPSAEAIAGRSLDLIDMRYQPETDR
jgi:hypothetical protein